MYNCNLQDKYTVFNLSPLFPKQGKIHKKQTNKQTKPIKTQNGLKLELEKEKEGNPAQLNRLGSQASLPKQPILLLLVHGFIA